MDAILLYLSIFEVESHTVVSCVFILLDISILFLIGNIQKAVHVSSILSKEQPAEEQVF
jgi:hypothetical protein